MWPQSHQLGCKKTNSKVFCIWVAAGLSTAFALVPWSSLFENISRFSNTLHKHQWLPSFCTLLVLLSTIQVQNATNTIWHLCLVLVRGDYGILVRAPKVRSHSFGSGAWGNGLLLAGWQNTLAHAHRLTGGSILACTTLSLPRQMLGIFVMADSREISATSKPWSLSWSN